MFLSETGQSLFEVLLALAIFTIAVTTIAHLFLGSHYSAIHSLEKTQAILLAKEGIEAVRSIRDANFENITTTTNAGIVLVDNKWTLQNAPDKIDKFTRRIDIGEVDTGIWQVTSTVTWISPTGRQFAVSLSEYLTSWRLPTPTAGLIGWWQMEDFNGTLVLDSSDQGNHGIFYGGNNGTLNGPTWTTSTSKIGAALSFDGTDDYVSIPDSPSLSPTSAITISAWVILNATGTNWQPISFKEGPEGRAWWLGFFPGNPARIHWSNGGLSTWDLSCDIPSALNTWRHIVATYQSGGIGRKIFVDGTLICSDTATGNLLDTSGNVYIGGGGWQPINGAIDEVRIYNRALSAEEIGAIYNQGLGSQAAIRDGLVGEWRFDEATGTIAYDTSQWVNGKVGNWALSFDGFDDYVDTLTPNPGAGAFSVCAWIKSPTKSGRIIAQDETNSPGGWALSLGDPGTLNDVRFYYRGAGTVNLDAMGLNLTDGNWHFLCGVRDPSIGKREIYHNGSLVASLTGDTFSTSSAEKIIIGGESSSSTDYPISQIRAIIDEVRIYNRALSQTEIRFLYGR
jgi:hypothetical protein